MAIYNPFLFFLLQAMLDFPPNLDDGEFWLPSDLFYEIQTPSDASSEDDSTINFPSDIISPVFMEPNEVPPTIGLAKRDHQRILEAPQEKKIGEFATKHKGTGVFLPRASNSRSKGKGLKIAGDVNKK